MSRIILLICGALVAAFLLVAGFAYYLNHRQDEMLTQAPDHGTTFILEVDSSGTNEISILKEAIRRRASRLGVRVYWEPISKSQVRVTAALRNPGDSPQVQRFLFSHGVLAFRLVHEDSDRLIESGEVPPGYEILKREILSPPRPMYFEKVLAKIESESGLSGNLIERAMVVRGNLGEPQIDFTMQRAPAAAFEKVTGENVGRRLAIVLDGRLYSAPTIQAPITGGRGQITGQFSTEEAFALAAAMETPLPMTVTVVESKAY